MKTFASRSPRTAVRRPPGPKAGPEDSGINSFEVENDIPVLKDNELLEISVVPIPANPGAMALALKSDGIIDRIAGRPTIDEAFAKLTGVKG
jgi:hypothetical protein